MIGAGRYEKLPMKSTEQTQSPGGEIKDEEKCNGKPTNEVITFTITITYFPTDINIII